jgi:hypothetical protein
MGAPHIENARSGAFTYRRENPSARKKYPAPIRSRVEQASGLLGRASVCV